MQVQPKPDSEKVMLWVAADFAEGGAEPSYEQFAMRFKSAEIAQSFKEKVDECKVSWVFYSIKSSILNMSMIDKQKH